ncbi:MAG: Gfo/Idh/MocA family protein [Candidatus Promineifilaceae bacterium]
MTEKVRWGLLSTANINRALIPPIRASERSELTAVASRSQESAEVYAAEWNIPLAFGSYEAMLESDAVDAVYISLPNHLHAEWSIKAMENGKHVLCEKPFALTVEEVDRVRAVSEETGMVISEAFMYRHHPQTKIAEEFIRSGRLGDVTTVRGVFTFKMGSRDNVRLVPEWGGGSLWDVGCYPMSMAQFLLGGPPQWVFGDQWLGPEGVDDTFVGQMHYEGGRMSQFTCGFRTPEHAYVEVLGTNGILRIHEPFKPKLSDNNFLFENVDGEVDEIPVPEKELYLGEVEDLESAVLDGAEPYLSLDETRNHIRTIVALYESAAKNAPVTLA